MGGIGGCWGRWGNCDFGGGSRRDGVNKGVLLSWLQFAAFDRLLLEVDTSFVRPVRRGILGEKDGPLLRQRVIVPNRRMRAICEGGAVLRICSNPNTIRYSMMLIAAVILIIQIFKLHR